MLADYWEGAYTTTTTATTLNGLTLAEWIYTQCFSLTIHLIFKLKNCTFPLSWIIKDVIYKMDVSNKIKPKDLNLVMLLPYQIMGIPLKHGENSSSSSSRKRKKERKLHGAQKPKLIDSRIPLIQTLKLQNPYTLAEEEGKSQFWRLWYLQPLGSYCHTIFSYEINCSGLLYSSVSLLGNKKTPENTEGSFIALNQHLAEVSQWNNPQIIQPRYRSSNKKLSLRTYVSSVEQYVTIQHLLSTKDDR